MNSPSRKPSRRAAPDLDHGMDGVLIVDKPAGPTSHDIVDRARRILNIRKIGHGGTLDPLATGVLVLLIGRGTKLSNYFLGSDKAYEGTITFGVRTDSHDAAGDITSERDASGLTENAILEEMEKMVGDQMQTPPQVSAVKIDGMPMYKRARKGQVVEIKPRLVHIYSFAMLSAELPNADFRMRCTKGTYVRKCADDIGEALGCGAHLSRLRRTHSGEFSLENAVTMSALTEMRREEISSRILPVSQFAMHHTGARKLS